MLKRQIATFTLIVVALALASFAPSITVIHAQQVPYPIIDAAYKDLSGRLGKSVTRGGDSNWSYEADVFPDASLGCPQPGKVYAQTRISGYKIIITYPRSNGSDYDYRASTDGSTLFLCTINNSPVTAVTPTPGNNPTASSVTFTNPFAFIGADGNVVMAQIGNSAAVRITSDSTLTGAPGDPFPQTSKTYTNLIWSPDGTKLAFIESQSQTLFVSTSGNSPIPVVKQAMGAAWSSDSSKLAYFVRTSQMTGSNNMDNIWQAQAVPIAASGAPGTPQYAGEISMGGGCGGGGESPSLFLYYVDAGYNGNPTQAVWTDKGFVYTTNCVGIGLALRDSTGKVVWEVADAGKVAISPDRTHAAAVRFDAQHNPLGIVSIDLNTGATTQLSSDTTVDQLAWSADNSTILFSKRVPGQTVSANASNPLYHKYNGPGWLVNAQSYAVTLWRMPAAGGQATQLFQRDGYAIGVIAPAPDNSGVLFSFIPAMTDLANALNANASQDAITAAVPKLSLVYVAWNGGQPINLTPGGHPVFGKGSFTALSSSATTASNSSNSGSQPSGNTGNLTPPALVIGKQAIVITTAGQTLNLRRTPGINADILGILKPGTVVTVEAGPQVADGFRWWKVITIADGREGWVVDQVTDSSGTNNTLSPQ